MVKNAIIAALGLALIGLAFLYSNSNTVPAEAMPVPPSPVVEEERMCAQVITPARNPDTGDITEFPTPCDVPDGWEIIQNDIPDLELELQY